MSEQEEPIEPVYLPSNEPYLGRASVFLLDQTITTSLAGNNAVAHYTRTHQLSDLQSAACQIVPQGINLALTIRELVRQGYLFGATVLLRSLVERAAIISYLVKKPAAVQLWKDGWEHRERPSLLEMLETMGSGEVDRQQLKLAAELLHHITHGDPVGSTYNLVELSDGGLGYSVGKALNEPKQCDFICEQALCYLIVLMGRTAESFPGVLSQEDLAEAPKEPA